MELFINFYYGWSEIGTEIVIYDDVSTFKTVYALDYSKTEHNVEIRDFYTKLDEDGTEHLWVATDLFRETSRPELHRSIVLFHSDTKDSYFGSIGYQPQFCPRLVEHNEIEFNQKTQLVTFGKKGWWIFKKPILELPVGRYYGDHTFNKKVKIDSDNIYFDLVRDRINLVLK